jgi:hypothetical protein
MDASELKEVLGKHGKWWRDEEGGEMANLRGADLREANLRGADLREADLCGADLREANLRGAYLCGADLRGANLCGADLREADLCGADLRGADLRGADLRGADLEDANEVEKARLPHFQIPEGDLLVWKKVQGRLVNLLIPKEAKRTGSLVGRKCRAEYAKVLNIEGGEPVTSQGQQYPATTYAVGETVRPDKYNPDPRIECASGIHFFLTRAEAEEWPT